MDTTNLSSVDGSMKQNIFHFDNFEKFCQKTESTVRCQQKLQITLKKIEILNIPEFHKMQLAEKRQQNDLHNKQIVFCSAHM